MPLPTTASSLPRPPSLAELLDMGSRFGLRAVFAEYDKRVQKWVDESEVARRATGSPLPVPTGPLLSANSRARNGAVAGSLPNAGWVFYDYEARVGDASTTLRPQSRAIAIEPTEFRQDWKDSGALAAGWINRTSQGEFFSWAAYLKSGGVLAPRTFIVSFDENKTTEGYRSTRLLCRVVLMPGSKIVAQGTTYPAITEAVRTVTKRIGPGQYIAWLESAETDNPTPTRNLHVAAIYAEAV